MKRLTLVFLLATCGNLFVRSYHHGPRHSRMPMACEQDVRYDLAYSLYEKMNRSADPCDDFYEYACGQFEKYATIPEDQSFYDLFSVMEKKVQKHLKKSIVRVKHSEHTPKAFETLKFYYDTCMDTELEKTSNKHFMEELNQVGKWPLLHKDSWEESDFNWQKDAEKFRLHGFSYNYFIGFDIDVDMQNNSLATIQVDQPSFGTYQEYLSHGRDHEVVKKYYHYMVDLAVMFGADKVYAEEELEKVLDFEIALAKISWSNAQRRSLSTMYHPTSMNDLQSTYSFVSWKEFFNRMMMMMMPMMMPNEMVNVRMPDYLKGLEILMKQTPNRVLANYAFWRALAEFAPYLSYEVKNLKWEFEASITGNKYMKPRWEECVDHLNENMYIATDSLYARNYVHDETKATMLDLVYRVKNEIHRMIAEIDSTDRETIQAAQNKLDEILPMVAYSEKLFDNSMVDGYYMGMEVNRDSLIKTVLNFNKFMVKHQVEKLKKPYERKDWTEFTRVAVAKTYASSSQNAIKYPAGILQGEMFSPENPNYMNYGAIGSNIGYTMSCSFADIFNKFDKNGNIAQCFDEQYKKYYFNNEYYHHYGYRHNYSTNSSYNNSDNSIHTKYYIAEANMHVDGPRTPGYYLADYAGLRLAYKAYKEWMLSHNPEEPQEYHLPSPMKDYTPKQMFWISYANTYCTKYRPEYFVNYASVEPFIPAKYRLIGAVSNMPEFAEDFQCKPGSKMNPTNRCHF